MRLINRQSTGQIKNVKEFAMAETSLRNKNQTQYRQAIARLAKKIVSNERNYNEFINGVKKYAEDTGQKDKAGFNPDAFINYYTDTTNGKVTEITYLSSTEKYNVFDDIRPLSLRNKDRKYNEAEGRELFVKYAIDAMITQHNQRLTNIEKLEKKYSEKDTDSNEATKTVFNGTYVKVDLEKSVAGSKTTMNLDEFLHQFLNEDIIDIKSREDSYIVLDSYSDDVRNKLLKYNVNDEYRLTKKSLRDTGSYTLMFINNLTYALAKFGWYKAYKKVLEMIQKDMLKEIYEAYNSLNIELVWKYNEDNPVDDGNGSYDDESTLLEALNKAMKDKQAERDAAEKKKSKKQKTKKK